MKLSTTDPEIYQSISLEEQRQTDVLEMIPSENYTSRAVREAVGSVLINKYAEGQVGARYYQGNVNIDTVERLCKSRALTLFGLSSDEWGVNVQALSGSPANLAVINALVPMGGTIMSMFLPDGGHLSHGWQTANKKITLVSKIWNIEFYHVDPKTRVFDYDAIQKQALVIKPKLLISGGTAYPREINHKRMGEIAKSVGGCYLADVAHEAGLIAAGVNTSPFPHADVVSTTTHKTLRGPRGALIFSRIELSKQIDQSVFPGIQGGPHEHTIGGIAVALKEAQTKEFRTYQAQVLANANVLAKLFMNGGLDVVTGGTDKHLILIDLRSVSASSWVVATALEYAGIVINRNTVPNDSGTSIYPSGIRMGTPAITTRGMKEKDMEKIGAWIIEIIRHVASYQMPEDKEKRKEFIKSFHKTIVSDTVIKRIAGDVKSFVRKFPVP